MKKTILIIALALSSFGLFAQTKTIQNIVDEYWNRYSTYVERGDTRRAEQEEADLLQVLGLGYSYLDADARGDATSMSLYKTKIEALTGYTVEEPVYAYTGTLVVIADVDTITMANGTRIVGATGNNLVLEKGSYRTTLRRDEYNTKYGYLVDLTGVVLGDTLRYFDNDTLSDSHDDYTALSRTAISSLVDGRINISAGPLVDWTLDRDTIWIGTSSAYLTGFNDRIRISDTDIPSAYLDITIETDGAKLSEVGEILFWRDGGSLDVLKEYSVDTASDYDETQCVMSMEASKLYTLWKIAEGVVSDNELGYQDTLYFTDNGDMFLAGGSSELRLGSKTFGPLDEMYIQPTTNGVNLSRLGYLSFHQNIYGDSPGDKVNEFSTDTNVVSESAAFYSAGATKALIAGRLAGYTPGSAYPFTFNPDTVINSSKVLIQVFGGSDSSYYDWAELPTYDTLTVQKITADTVVCISQCSDYVTSNNTKGPLAYYRDFKFHNRLSPFSENDLDTVNHDRKYLASYVNGLEDVVERVVIHNYRQHLMIIGLVVVVVLLIVWNVYLTIRK